MNRWKIGFLGFLAILIIGANIATWYFLFERKTIEPKVSLPLPTSTLAPSPLPSVDETSLIKQAVFIKTGLDETKAEVSISQNTGRHVKGTIREFEAVGGAYWLAAKSASGGWICVYDGQANPSCSQIAPYDFPKDMVPECLNSSGQVVKR